MDQELTYFSRGSYEGEIYEIPLVVMEDFTKAIEKRYRLILVKEGTGIVKLNGVKQHFIAPCVFCLPCGISEYQMISEHAVHTREIVFHPLFLNPNYEEVDPEILWILAFQFRSEFYQGVLQVDLLTCQRIEQLMKSLDEVLQTSVDALWVCRARSYLIEALVVVDRHYLRTIEIVQKQKSHQVAMMIPEYSTLLNDLLNYLHTHYNESISIEGLCQIFLLNRTTLNQLFKESIGVTITQYLIQLRLYLAKTMLCHTLLSISEIMERVGYFDMTHFNRAFKQHVGMTPSQYRKQNKEI